MKGVSDLQKLTRSTTRFDSVTFIGRFVDCNCLDDKHCHWAECSIIILAGTAVIFVALRFNSFDS